MQLYRAAFDKPQHNNNAEADPEAVARGGDAGGLGKEVPQRGPAAELLVGVRGQSRPKWESGGDLDKF